MRAAPEGVALIDAKGLSAALQPLELTEKTADEVCRICGELRRFEQDKKPTMKTDHQRNRALREIAAKAADLQQATANLSNGDSMWLDTYLANTEGLGIDMSVLPIERLTNGIGARLETVRHVVESLAKAATNTADALVNERGGGLGGRKSIQPAYAGFIAALAVAVKADRIRAGRNNKFHRLCDLVFDAANIPAKPEGPLRYYLENWHADYVKRGYVFS